MHLKMIHFLIIFCLIFLSKSDDCDTTHCRRSGNECVNANAATGTSGICSQYCKPNLLSDSDTKCYDCSSGGDTITNKYYTINGLSCSRSNSCDGKIIQGNEWNQCVSSCGNLYELGDFCYKIGDLNNDKVSCYESKICKCKYAYFIEAIDGKDKYNCYSSNSCQESYIYYNSDTGLCSNTDCPSTQKKKDLGGGKYRCSNECINGEFLLTKSDGSVTNRNYCVDACPEHFYYIDYPNKKCLGSSCGTGKLQLDDTYQCIEESNCNFIDGSKCFSSSCSGSNQYHNIGEKNCISTCQAPKKFKLGNICYSECPSHFINTDETECVPEVDTGNCFFVESEIIAQNNRKCYSACPDGHLYYNINSKKCISDCNIEGNSYKFHKQGEFICYPSCIAISTSTIYEDNYVCSNTPCSNYFSTTENGVKKCYQSETECIGAGYRFKNGNECVYSCQNFKVPYADAISLGTCFDTKENCKTNGYYYYNSQDKICWRDGCGSDYKTNEIDESTSKPKEDSVGNTCTNTCYPPFSKLSNDGQFCKTKCDETSEYFKAYGTDANKCINGLSGCNEFIGANNECVSICPNFYYEEGTIKKCVENCHDIGKHYYEGDKKCYDDCDIFSSSNDVDGKCLKRCSQNEKIHNKRCVPECPNTDPYYIETTIMGEQANKCVASCVVANSLYTKIIEYNNQCVKNCPPNFHAIGDKCYSYCPEGEKYFDPSTLTCGGRCPSGLPKFEKLEGSDIYICKSSCDGINEYTIKGECVFSCADPYNKIGADKECKESCSSDSNGHFYTEIETVGATSNKLYKCCTCPSTDTPYFKGEECYQQCPEHFKYVINNQHECLPGCPDNYPYYDKAHPDSSNGHFICSDSFNCAANTYYLEGECVNENTCISQGKVYIENNICVPNCKEGFKYKKIDGHNIYECKGSCDGSDYIFDNNECVTKCPYGKNYIGKNNNCKVVCEEEDGLYYHFISDETSYKIYKCVSQCSGEYYLSSRENKECFKQCSDSTSYKFLSSSENMCYDNCLFSSLNKFTLNQNCLFECNDQTYKYYFDSDKICKDNCNPGHYAIQNINKCVPDCSSLTGNVYYSYISTGGDDPDYKVNTCVLQCPESNPFADGTTCVDICPETSRYYIKEFKHGETDLQRKCLNDCPQEYPFYTIDTSSTPNKYPCQSDCIEGFYVPNFSDQNIIAKLCLSACNGDNPYENYKYKIIDETNNNKTCYDVCPPEKPYHKEAGGSDCLAICPDDAPFHEIGSTICISANDCSGNYIDYETRQCLNTAYCPSSRRYKSKKDSKYICLNTCIQLYGEYLSPYNTCVEDCSSSELVSGKHLVNNIQNKKCVCENLYYIAHSLQLVCLENTIVNCKNAPDTYKIKMYGSNECIETCLDRGILSPSEDICYEESYQCSQIDTNSHLITKENGQKKCDCLYKYYIDGDQKKCLNEEDQCPNGYDKYIPSIKKCLKADDLCPDEYKFLFNNLCLDHCPIDSNQSGNNCECNDDNKIFWYEVSNGNYKCLPQCLDIHPVYVADTKQCLEKCTGTFYPNLFENKCYSSCDSNSNTELNIQGGISIEKNSELSKYICVCPDKWYIDESGENKKTICVSDCFSGAKIFKYLVRKTSQCVDECPEGYPYYFNNECYSSCENEAKQLYHLNLKTVAPLLECQCGNLWYFTDDEEPTKVCLTEDKCTLSSTNNIYLKEGTKQCKKECPLDMYKFNYICYYKCPEKTIDHIDIEHGNYCTCNLNDGYWYEYEDNGNKFYVCGKSECPKYNSNNDINHIRKNLIETEKKCVNSCLNDGAEGNEFKYALRNICIKECPILSKTVVDECIFYDLNDGELDELEKLKNAINVQSKELYENSNNLGGFLFNKYDTSIQIYAIDKHDTLKGVSLKSNLTYIDFGTCLEKIFTDKSLGNNGKILVSKYDLLTKENTQSNNKKKYLINKVEYELYSSIMNERIVASVCNPYEIIISYPLTLDKYDNYVNGINKNEYKKLFDIGKELNKKNNKLDTFNYNNTVYKDICTGIEIDGKDLVLEDRYKYLYPDDVFFCEHNCIMNNTDFELERINCLCNYKEEIDFEREDEDTEIKVYTSSQSSANVEILKCLGKLTVKQSIKNNEAFYYCAVITVVEISLSLFSFLTSFKTISTNISNLLNKIGLKNSATNKINIKKNVKFKNENITTTNRALNNPPKKRTNDDGEEDANNDKFTFDGNDIKSNNDDDVIFKENNIVKKEVVPNYDSNNDIKAEYIPPEFNFKFFKLNDKGVIKKIERSKLPFKIEPDTRYLIEAREGVNYDEDYLNGPFYSDQNILVVVDSN